MVSIGGAAPVAFYGQLSHAQLRPNQPLPLPADPEVSAADAQQFQDHELVQAIRLLTMAGERERQRAFVLRLGELSETGAWKDMTASLAHEIDRPDLAVAVARQSIRAGTPLVRNGYPVLSITEAGAEPYAVEMPLVHAIVRQESSFDVRAVSPAGAQGLMQLMPGTARSVASTLALPYSPGELTNNAEYNISLGRAYIGSMLNRSKVPISWRWPPTTPGPAESTSGWAQTATHASERRPPSTGSNLSRSWKPATMCSAVWKTCRSIEPEPAAPCS